MTEPLFELITIGALELPNRIIMSPMIRIRADQDGVPTESMVRYYSQRASAGLIISELVLFVIPLPGITQE